MYKMFILNTLYVYNLTYYTCNTRWLDSENNAIKYNNVVI